jgi:hypothetical protein
LTLALMLALLWAGAVATWLAWWAIEAGGTMGAL